MLPRPLRLLPSESAPADAQIAAGIAMLAGLEQGVPAMRWYSVAPPALLLGMSQQRDLLDEAACGREGVAIHRRQSGGGVVLANDALLMLDVALPHNDPLASSDLTEAYRWLGEAAAAALGSLGAAVRIVPIQEARADTRELAPLLQKICFAGRSPYEVCAGEHKIVGLAQIRRRHGALFQLGIYARWEPQRTAALLALPEQERPALTQALAARVAGIADLFDQPVVVAAVRQAIEGALEARSGFRIAPDQWRADERTVWAEAQPRYAELG